MELTAEGLLCGLCGFHLSSTDEVEAAGLPTVVRYSVENLTRIVAEGPDPAERLATLKLALPTVQTHAHDSF
ncbi:hypothetical protein GCM10010246_84130 [Streptomyces cuspidosporus]|uniref:HMA domain-containing protein n=1 Tax=Streptomyces cuspidosporus TaxID=66882 RepID=A0ABN3HCY5_9ACTN